MRVLTKSQKTEKSQNPSTVASYATYRRRLSHSVRRLVHPEEIFRQTAKETGEHKTHEILSGQYEMYETMKALQSATDSGGAIVCSAR